MPLKVQGQLTLCLVSIGASNFENKNSDVLIGRNFLTLPSLSNRYLSLYQGAWRGLALHLIKNQR